MFQQGQWVKVTKYCPERGYIGVIAEVLPKQSPFAPQEYKVGLSIGMYSMSYKTYTASQIEPYFNTRKCICGSQYDSFGGHYSYCEDYMSGQNSEEIL